MIHVFPPARDPHEARGTQVICEHRTVSKDGRIVCLKIAQGDNTVSPDVCRGCPARTVNCSHLRFSLSYSPHVPLLVRFNGRTEVWNDDTPELRFCNAACAARVAPVLQPRSCATCPLRSPCQATGPAALSARTVAASGGVVAFRTGEPEPALATG